MINLYGNLQVKIANTEADRLTYTPLVGEPIWCEETKLFYVGDGVTVGGIEIASDSDIEQELTQLRDDLNTEILTRSNADIALDERIDQTNTSVSDLTLVVNSKASTSYVDSENSAQNLIIAGKANSADLATVATSGSYNDLSDKPTVAGQVNSDWNATSGVEEILNKPTTLSGYGITDAINISQKGAANGVASLGSDGKVPSTQLPDNDVLSVNGQTGVVVLDKTNIGLGNVDNTSDINKPISNATQLALNDKANSADLATVATSGSYNDLSDKPVISYPVTSVNGQTGVVVLDKDDVGLSNVDNTSDLNKPISTATQTALNAKANSADLATVATSGSYNDLSDKPTIVGQVNSDWNATSGVAQILNKPTTLSGYGITDAINVSQKGAVNGVATLGSDGKIPNNQLPPIAISDTFVVSSEVAMLALDVQTGDIAVRSDVSKSFINTTGNNGLITDWTELLSPPNAVLSVNGQTGAVVLNKTSVGLGNVDNTSDLNKPISTATQTALNAKASTSYVDSENDAQDLIIAAKANSADLATVATSGSYNDLSDKPVISYPVTSVNGQTGAVVLNKTSVGLGNVDNTSDLNKPISTATQTALDGKVNNFTSQTAKTVFAAPNGAAGVPSFRVLLSSDISDISTNYVGVSRTVTAGTGLTGGGDLSANRTIALNATSIASLGKADTALQPAAIGTTVQAYSANLTSWSSLAPSAKADSVTTVSAGTGLTGGGDLSANRTISLSTASITSLGKADTALQPAAIGTTVQGYSANLASWSSLAPSTKADSATTISAGTGLTGGGSLAANRTISLSAGSITSLGKADTALQSVVAGTNVTIDNTDPLNPIISSSGSSSVVWGGITGTLSDQSDLQTALNAKANTSSLSAVATSGLFADLLSKPTTLSGYGITDAVPSTRTVTAGNGLSGGGALSGNITVTLGTPSTLTASTSNGVTSTSHTHAITGFLPLTGGTMTGAINGPNGTAAATSFSARAAGNGMFSSAANTLDFAAGGVVGFNIAQGAASPNTYVSIKNYNNASDSTSGPHITAQGTYANQSLWLDAKGTGNVYINNGNNWAGMYIAGTGAYLRLESASSDGAFIYASGGSTANVQVKISGKGGYGATLVNGNNQGIYISGTSTESYIDTVSNSANANLEIYAKGTGTVEILSPAAARMASITLNSSSTLTTTALNRIVKKTDTSAYTYTIPSALGSDDDTITIVNAGSSGTVTVQGSGVTLYRAGTSGSVTVDPYSAVTFVRVSSTIWVA